jgi:hypothetical protein
MENVEPTDLERTGPPGADLARLSLAFAEQLQRQALSDQATVYGMGLHAATHRLLGLPLLLFDTPVRSARQRELLAAIVERSPAVLALTLEADGESRTPLSRPLGVGSELSDEDGHVTTLDRVRRQVLRRSSSGRERTRPLSFSPRRVRVSNAWRSRGACGGWPRTALPSIAWRCCCGVRRSISRCSRTRYAVRG